MGFKLEVFPTDGAAEGHFSRVNLLMLKHVRLQSKAFATDRTAERFLARVDPHVVFELPPPAKLLGTNGAAEASSFSVKNHVS